MFNIQKSILGLSIICALSACDSTVTPAFEAELYRTEGGVPHIVAKDWGSLGFGTGYAAAEDHFCEQARNALKFRGELSQYFGAAEGNLQSDFFFKLLEKEGTFDEPIDTEFERLFAGYAAGFNRYLRDTGLENITDPACAGADWVVPLSVTDVRRFHLTPAFLPNFAPLVIAAQPPLAAPIEAANDDKTAAAVELPVAELSTTEMLAYAEGFYNPTDKGSNGVAVGKALSHNGSGLLFANPHLKWKEFDFRMYAMHQIMPGVSNVLGANQAQRAHVGFGTNGDVAWTNTVSTSKAYMFYKLDLVPGNPLAYLFDGEERAIEPLTVTVDVKADDGSISQRSHTVYKANHGYMVGGKFPWNAHMGVSLRIANEGARGFQGGALAMARAKNVEELKAAINQYQSTPGINTIAVDSTGTALYGDLGPVVNFTDAQLKSCLFYQGPMFKGNTAECEWNTDVDSAVPGLLGASQQAALMRDDFVTNSNDSYWLANPAAPIANIAAIQGTSDSERTLRTRSGLTMLTEQVPEGGFDLDSLAGLMLSNQNYAAQLLRDGVVIMCQAQPRVQLEGRAVDLTEACAVLAAWDMHANIESRGAHIFREFMRAANNAEYTRWLPKAFNFKVGYDSADPINTPRELDLNNNPAVLPALARAVVLLDEVGIALDAPLGDLQSVTRNGERIALHGGEEFEGVFNKMAFDTINAEGYPDVTGSAASWVMLTELTPEHTKVRGVISYSQSSDISSEHYSDMTQLFSQKKLVDIPYELEDVKAAALNHISLSEGADQCSHWQQFTTLAFTDQALCNKYFTAIVVDQLTGYVQ